MQASSLVLTISATLFAAPLLARGGLDAQDAFNLERAADPQISPDSRRIVYVRHFADAQTDRNYSSLWLLTSDGHEHQPLTSGRASDSSPRWSPDGTRLAYLSDRDGKPQIHVRWMDTGQTAAVTSLEYPPSGIAWSPDGTLLSFVSLVKRQARSLVALPAAPAGATWAEPPKLIDRLVYRFNGPGYLPEGFSQVFVVPAEGGTARQLTSGEFNHGETGWGSGATAWTRDGTILFVANRRPDWELEPYDTEVYEVSPQDGSLRALTSRRGPDLDPAPSPDGRWIAYLGYDERYQGYQVKRVSVMSRDGSGTRVLTGGLDRSVEDLAWAPDGSGLYVVYDERGDTELAFVGLDGRLRHVASHLGSGTSSYSGGAAFSVAADGTIAYTRRTAQVPGDVAVLTRAAREPRVLTAVNEDLLVQRTLGAVEEFWCESKHDRRRIQGWIVKPPGFDPAKRYPLLLEIHGGPFANYGPRFDLEKQVWAARGYVVAYVNPRGSSSYGEEFGNLIHHAYPGDDFYDLDSAVDAMLAKGYVDEKNLFVGGGSGGGVLTAWMIGRSDRFRAAVAYYPVINWTSWVLTSDIPVLGVKYWFPGPPWDHPEHYAKRSLLSVVKNVKTPTMVITGEEDYRTPMAESEQYYTALKLLGVETVLVRVPDEPHGIRRRPSHWMAKMLYVSAWLDRHRV